MDSATVPAALARRLGEDGTEGLVSVLDAFREEWSETVVTLAVDWFERRLTQEISALRVDVARELAGLRSDIGRALGALRAEIAGFRVEMAGVRVEQLKWSFVFWIGQVAATGGLIALMVRMLG